MILAINAGSSSLKFGLFEERASNSPDALVALGAARSIDHQFSQAEIVDAAGKSVLRATWPGLAEEALIERILEWARTHQADFGSLVAVGHRVVHGGPHFRGPMRIDMDRLKELEALVPLAPLHQPQCLRPVRFIGRNYRELAQVACFDTDFHSTITPPANMYALPSRLVDQGIRRYGFHGLSFQSIADQLRLTADKHILDERIVIAHLGSGASLCALRNLESVDTTMGFSTLDGLVMGTRPGALDPGIILYLMTAHNYSTQEIETLLYRESGLLGVSGISADVQVLLASPEPAATRAIELFVFQAARQVAALATTLGGLDRLVFTGGIGEHSSAIRERIARGLELFDIQLNVAANEACEERISLPESPVIVEVRAAREEHVIAEGVRATTR